MKIIKKLKRFYDISNIPLRLIDYKDRMEMFQDYEYALPLSDSYLRKPDQLYSYSNMYTLWVNMLLDYTNIVKKLKESRGYS